MQSIAHNIMAELVDASIASLRICGNAVVATGTLSQGSDLDCGQTVRGEMRYSPVRVRIPLVLGAKKPLPCGWCGGVGKHKPGCRNGGK